MAEPETVQSETPEKNAVAPVVETRDFEADAREMGWVPKDKYKGEPDKWRDAPEFVANGETILPIVRAQNKKLRAEREEVERDFKARIERMEHMGKVSMDRMKAQHANELAAVKAAQKIAVEAGDTNEYDRLDIRREALAKVNFDDPATVMQDDKSAIDAWRVDNDWYLSDFDLTKEAEAYSQFLAQADPKMPMSANLKKVEAHVKKKYPEKFGGKPAAKNGHAAVDGGSPFNSPPSKPQAADARLKPEERAQAERDVKAGLYKSTAEWANVYFGK